MAQVFLPTRRAVLMGAAATGLAGVLLESRTRAAAGSGFRFLTPHQAVVVTEATARLVPGPLDDPAEAGHPGAREADVVRYVDTLLSAFDEDPPRVFAGGPWSDRHSSGPDYTAQFVPLDEPQLLSWKTRVAELRTTVPQAVQALDAAAQADTFADFPSAPTVEQDRILAAEATARDLLFTLTIEGMYALPEYGGNKDLLGWRDIGWRGDVQPRGWTAAEVEAYDGLDPVAVGDLGVVQEAIGALPAVQGALAKTWRRHG
jgi:hypothetical protein